MCTHDYSEMDTAIYADGVCPLCLQSRIAALEAALAEAREVVKPFALAKNSLPSYERAAEWLKKQEASA